MLHELNDSKVCTKHTNEIRVLRTLPEASSLMNLSCSLVSQHPADYISILFIPDIIAHGSPAMFMENFHTAFVKTWPIHQPYQGLLHWKPNTQNRSFVSRYTNALAEGFLHFCCNYLVCLQSVYKHSIVIYAKKTTIKALAHFWRDSFIVFISLTKLCESHQYENKLRWMGFFLTCWKIKIP